MAHPQTEALQSLDIYTSTYGCQMNVVDTESMVRVLERDHPTHIVDEVEQANVLIMNTCSIREKAQEKVFSELGRWRKHKQKHPGCVIVVAGCVASQEGQAIIERAPFVDIVIGPQVIHRLSEYITSARQKRRAIIDVSFPKTEKFDSIPVAKASSAIASVTIMEGCSQFCSFCVVPYTRGQELSRPFDDVLYEVNELVKKGAKEVIFLGQNVNNYRGEMHNKQHADLALLIHYAAAIEGLERIRYTTSHPRFFDDNLIAAYAEEKKLAKHLHLPVQSGSNRILTQMKRGYPRERFIEQVQKLRAICPQITVSSDFICGYPGETDEDHQQTLDLIRTCNIDQSYVFIYSPRPGTPAADLHDQPVPEAVAQNRLKEINALLHQNTQAINERMLNTTQRILVTGTSKRHDNELTGKTENNRTVNFIGDSQLIGQMVDITITGVHQHSLRGKQAIYDEA